MKKKLFVLAVIVLCFAVTASGSFAYYSYEDKAHNVITTGGIDIEIEETMRRIDGTITNFPADGIHNAEPGGTYSKIVKVENVGENAAWVRAKVEIEVIAANGTTMIPVEYVNGVGYRLISVDMLEGWLDGGDGYYYYREPLAPGEKTTALFDRVKYDWRMGNAYQNSTTNIIIYAQGVQTANNGSDVMQVLGWPQDVSKND